MRVRINSIDVIGGGRRIDLKPGLNIVTGPMTTGKTTFLRLCRALLGSGIEPASYPREVRSNVAAIAGDLLLGDKAFVMVRPFVSTATAKIDISGEVESSRLPALQADSTSEKTYTRWLLEVLGLPYIRVPSAPTQPESTPTPVTINDYLLYCVLPQDEIDNMVCGHRDPFKNIKRRYVFQILYGLYDVETAAVQDQLRQVASDIRQLKSQTAAFDRFLVDTPWEHRADLLAQLEAARRSLNSIQEDIDELADPSALPPDAVSLRSDVRRLDEERAKIKAALAQEATSIEQLSRLMQQLEAQSAQLTRAIVAGRHLLDFEFLVCPRCGTEVDVQRAPSNICGLCLQSPERDSLDRQALIAEQERLGLQIGETQDLIESHREAIHSMERKLGVMDSERIRLGSALDFLTQSYISDVGSVLAGKAARRAEIESSIRRLEDYVGLYQKLDRALGDLAELEARKEQLEAALEIAKTRSSRAEERIERLEFEYAGVLSQFDLPRFTDPPTARIDRSTFLPMIDGRRFDELSSQGLQVLVNVAHAIAHQRTGLALNLLLPNILLIDGLTSNVGHEGPDLQRIHRVYQYLIELSEQAREQLQIIVADNDVPVEARDFVRVELTEQDRLIRTSHSLASAGEEGPAS